jgi:hypothetical protein
MIAQSLILAAACTAAASPIVARDAYPKSTWSKGFKLVINVTDTALDFADSPVHLLQITPVHVGAGLNAPVPVTNGSTFFTNTVNNTVQLEVTGPTPMGIYMSSEPEPGNATLFDIGINNGLGTPGISVFAGEPMHPIPCHALAAPRPGTFAVCDLGFESYAHPKRVLGFVYQPSDKWYSQENVPDNCVAVKLFPECTGLTSPHGDVLETRCYDNVSAIDWSQYQQCYGMSGI